MSEQTEDTEVIENLDLLLHFETLSDSKDSELIQDLDEVAEETEGETHEAP